MGEGCGYQSTALSNLVSVEFIFNENEKTVWSSGLEYRLFYKRNVMETKEEEEISAHADGGPCSPSAHAGLFARPPISMSGNFLAHVSAESPSNISPNPSEVKSEVSEP